MLLPLVALPGQNSKFINPTLLLVLEDPYYI